ncbi:MAG: aspartate aminotransferase family protein [Bacteroidota bacterium]
MIDSDNRILELENEQLDKPFAHLFSDQEVNLALYNQIIEKGRGIINQSLEKNKKPCSGVSPAQLSKQFDSVDLNIPMPTIDSTLEELEKLYLDHAVYFHQPSYAAHLNCPIVTPGLLAEVILSSINSSVDTYDQSLGGTFIEKKVIEWTNDRIGYDKESDGIFTSGGTQSNMKALLIARDHYCWKRLGHSVFKNGLPAEARKFRIFTSEISHFSIQKNAALIGLGQDAVVPISVDHEFRMDVGQLESKILASLRDGFIPIAVIATCGTTDFGSIDPLYPIAEIAHDYGLWMHADAAYGCGLLLSNEYTHLIDGLNLADSVTVDYHKSFFQPVSCSAFLVKNKQHFNYFTYHADYLNPETQDDEGIPNQVNKSIQTTKRFDALKVWLTLRIMGPQHLGEYFDEPILLAKKVAAYIHKDPLFELIHEPTLGTLVFRYIPKGEMPANRIDEINANIRKDLFKSGEALVAGTKFRGVQYLKFTLMNPTSTLQDILRILNMIKHYAKQYK